MRALRAVLDANVYVSAAIHPTGPPGRIIEGFLRRASFQIVLSPPIIDEVLRALTYPKIRRHLRRGADPDLWFEDILVLSDVVEGQRGPVGACADPDDDKYIAAAVEAQAGFVVTGDLEFLDLEEYEGIRIVTPRAFLGLLAAR